MNTWMGKPLDKYSKDELIDIIEYLVQQQERHYDKEYTQAYSLGRVEMFKRGLL